LIKEPKRRSHSALRGLLDAIPEQPKPKAQTLDMSAQSQAPTPKMNRYHFWDDSNPRALWYGYLYCPVYLNCSYIDRRWSAAS